jgi:hypothetical protein
MIATSFEYGTCVFNPSRVSERPVGCGFRIFPRNWSEMWLRSGVEVIVGGRPAKIEIFGL